MAYGHMHMFCWKDILGYYFDLDWNDILWGQTKRNCYLRREKYVTNKLVVPCRDFLISLSKWVGLSHFLPWMFKLYIFSIISSLLSVVYSWNIDLMVVVALRFLTTIFYRWPAKLFCFSYFFRILSDQTTYILATCLFYLTLYWTLAVSISCTDQCVRKLLSKLSYIYHIFVNIYRY